MYRGERVHLVRLAIVCAAWALGEALVWQLRAFALGPVVPALLAAAAYVATRDLFGSGGGGGDVTYWRNRPVDRDRWRR